MNATGQRIDQWFRQFYENEIIDSDEDDVITITISKYTLAALSYAFWLTNNDFMDEGYVIDRLVEQITAQRPEWYEIISPPSELF